MLCHIRRVLNSMTTRDNARETSIYDEGDDDDTNNDNDDDDNDEKKANKNVFSEYQNQRGRHTKKKF